MKKDQKIKPCPFCGEEYQPWGEIETGVVNNPLVWWDSNLRGESCAFIACWNCSAVVKGDSLEEVLEIWNNRANEQKNEEKES